MSYHPCRWYDPYPKLAFALKLLYLAPNKTQSKVIQQLQVFLLAEWDSPKATSLFKGLKPSKAKGGRWYDESGEAAQTVELLKNSPDFLKNKVADTLLEYLLAESA